MDSFFSDSVNESEIVRQMHALVDKTSGSGSVGDLEADGFNQCVELLRSVWPSSTGDERESTSSENGQNSPNAPSQSTIIGRLGRFEIRGLLGHGGFGVVLLAYDTTLAREIALKLPRPELLVASKMRERFLREAQAVALLDHPGIVPVFDAGEMGLVWYIAAGYVKGPSLAAWFREQAAPLPPKRAASIVLALTDAVSHAHSRGILHRDLKPSNVLLEPNETAGSDQLPFTPKLTDFGLAKRLEGDDDLTFSGMLVGTPRYMAPEQAGNLFREVGVATDVYGLGAILHELLTREPPFVGESNSEVLRQIQQAELSPAGLRRCAVPKDLETICLKCLRKETTRRYQSARELADDLQRFLSDEPVVARPIGPAARLARWCRRRPVIAALSAGLVATVAAGSAVACWQWYRAERHLADAETQARRAEAHFARAENTLLDLAWVVEESALWAPESEAFTESVGDKLDDYVATDKSSVDRLSPNDPINAARLSFDARRAAMSGRLEAAHHMFRAALDAWRELVADHPDKETYRRAMSLCLYSFSQLERDRPLSGEETDSLQRLHSFYRNMAQDPRIRGWSLKDYARLLLARGDVLFNVGRIVDAAKAFEIGVIATNALLETAAHDDAETLCLRGQLSIRLAKERRRLGQAELTAKLVSVARESLERAVELSPSNRISQRELADTYRFIGVRDRKREAGQSEELLLRATQLYEDLFQKDRTNLELQHVTGRCYRDLAYTQLQIGKDKEALASFTRGRDLWYPLYDRPDPLPPTDRVGFGRACHQEGKLAQAFHNSHVARRAFEAGIEMFQRPLRDNDGPARRQAPNLRVLITRAECHFYLARHQVAAGEIQAAKDNFKFTVDLLAPQARRRDADPAVKDIWAKASTELAKLTNRAAPMDIADDLPAKSQQ